MERIRVTDAEPDFGIDEALATSGFGEAWREADKRRSEYRRGSTKEIPTRILKPGVLMTIDDLYTLLNVYYWWNEDIIEPKDYLEDVFKDLDTPRVKEAVRALHDTFPEYCSREYSDPNDPVCTNQDGWKCFGRLVPKHKKLSTKRLAEEAVSFFGWFDDEDSDYDSSLTQGLRQFNEAALGRVGLSEVECDYAFEALKHECERREQGRKWLNLYREHVEAGGTINDFLDRALPQLLAADEDSLKNIAESYEDLPDDFLSWDASKKLALTNRYISEERDWFEMIDITYNWQTYGVVPPYLYAMRPDGVFPGEI
jgi:hypothetical protein